MASVFAQTLRDLEIIVVDDCSQIPPKTKHEKVTYLQNKTNLGPGASRNLGKANAKGTYMAFLDSDDYWHPEFLEECLSLFEKEPMAIMAYTNGENVNEKGEVLGPRRNEVAEVNTILPTILKKGRPWGTGGCLWKSEAIQNVHWLSTRTWEDYAFDVSAALHCNTIVGTIKKRIFYDVAGSDQLSKGNAEKAFTQKVASLQVMSKDLMKAGKKTHPEIHYFFWMILCNTLTNGLQKKHPSSSISILWKLLQEWSTGSTSFLLWAIRIFPRKWRLKGLRYLRSQKKKKYEQS